MAIPVFGKHFSSVFASEVLWNQQTLSKLPYNVFCSTGLTSALFPQVFVFVIINAALVKNFYVFCTVTITGKKMETGNGIFCLLTGTVFVNALTSQTRTHPFFLVRERALCGVTVLCGGNL